MRRWWLAGVITALAAPGATAQVGVTAAANSINPADIMHRIEIIADDSMRGRWTPSPELDQVARYVAGHFRRVGLRPGGANGSYLQHYPILDVQLDTANSSVAFANGATWHFGADVIWLAGGTVPKGVSGPSIVATGIRAADAPPEKRLEGTILFYVAATDARGNVSPDAQRTFLALRRDRPAALIVIAPLSDNVWAAASRQQLRVETTTGWGVSTEMPLLIVRDASARRALPGVDPARRRAAAATAFNASPLRTVSATVTVGHQTLSEATAPNAVGILPGRDSVLRNEYVVFSAHMDHVGVGRPDAHGDSIYNGADDDASGTTAVMELAEAFSRLTPRPKRSLIFLTVSGEERGLWGSEYFTTHPPVPIERIVADLNEDMVGRNWKDTIVVIGREQSDLGSTLARVNAAHPELHMAAIDDLWPAERFYYRSDHFNFARRGVPILFFFNGVHPDYHRPSDEASKIDAEKESRIVKLVFYLGLEVANAAQRPQWNPQSYKAIVEGSGR